MNTGTTATGVSSTTSVLLYFLAILLPPLAVFIVSACSVDFIINICLTILCWIPGIIHAWYVISKRERQIVVVYPFAPTAPVGAPAPAATTAPVSTTGPETAKAPGTAATKY